MRIHHTDTSGVLYQGDCLEVMRWLPSDSVDTLITDPPYGLSFMGKKWDYEVPSVAVWKECLRILKPGATALIFAGTRTQHRMAVNVEDAGFILKDTIMWIYGSGFPKSTDISKQIDKRNGRFFDQKFKDYCNERRKSLNLSLNDINKTLGTALTGGGFASTMMGDKLQNELPTLEMYRKLQFLLQLDNRYDKLIKQTEAEREVIGKNPNQIRKYKKNSSQWVKDTGIYRSNKKLEAMLTAPSTPEAKLWDGYGTALKPAYEPILVAMKPNDGTYAQNALRHGVAGLNIDGGRIDLKGIETHKTEVKSGLGNNIYGNYKNKPEVLTEMPRYSNKGRFPANIILNEEAGRLLDEQSGISMSTSFRPNGRGGTSPNPMSWTKDRKDGKKISGHNDKGGASRFFYCAKASKSERGDNSHPTVKPVSLMNYLCKLTATPTGGTVLDPFAGSATTGLACIDTDRKYILIEREVDYCSIATERIKNAQIRKMFK